MARIRFSTLLLATLLAACGGNETDSGTEDPPRAPLPTTLRGIDVSGLDRDQREVFFSVVTDVLSPCGEAFSVARCVDEQKTCGSCVPAARFLLRLASEDRSKADLRGAYRDRYARDAVKEIDLEGSPVRGSPMAPITMVEFADFECPYCGELDPVLTELVRIFDGRVRLVFKQFPLPGHPHALSAARAAVAADEQGKFWEIHDALFAHQRALEPVQIAGYLQEAGVDLPRYAIALNGPATNTRVQRDIDLGHRIGVDGTPSLFINGRQYDIQKLGGELPQLRAYIEEELER